MKKLAMVAAIAAIATATTVKAQNVQIYGLMDIGVQSYDSGTERLTRTTNNNYNTSRLGFRGTEDLGNGLKAKFELEAQISPDSGTLGSTVANQTFNRESWIGLEGNFGALRLGRTDLSRSSELEGFVGGSLGPNWHLHAINGTQIELGIDTSGAIRYTSPKIGGVVANIGYASGNANGATTDTNGDQIGLSVEMEIAKLRLAAGYHKSNAATTDQERHAKSFGVRYDFGWAKTGLAYVEGDVSTTGKSISKSAVASLGIPLSNGYGLTTVYAMTENGAQSSENKGNGYLVGLTKSLSKRTTLYTNYVSVSNESNSSMSFAGTTAPTTAGLDTSGIAVGINHTF